MQIPRGVPSNIFHAQNMLKSYNDEENAEGMATIAQALATMENIGEHINEMKRKHERTVRVQEVQSQLYGWRVSDWYLGKFCR